MPERLNIEAAAIRLGLSIHTVRRRLKAGTLGGEQVATRSGYRWVVLLDDAPSPVEPIVDAPPLRSTPDETLTLLLSQVEQERDYLRTLVADQQRTIEALAVLVARGQEVARLPAPADDHEASQVGEQVATQSVTLTRRSWWRFWR